MHDVEKQLKQLRKKRKASQLVELRGGINDRRLLHDGFVLYVLTDCNLAAPLAFMDGFGRASHEEVRAHVEQQYLDKSVEELAQYLCVTDCIVPEVMPDTERFLRNGN